MIIDIHAHSDPTLGVESLTQIREQCRRNGVGLVLLNSLGRWSPAPSKKEISEANDEARVCAMQSDGMIRWLAYLNPQNDDWQREMERCLRNGAVGIKLWISLRDKDGGLSNTTALIKTAAEKKVPVLIHTFHRVEHNLPGEMTLDEVGTLARRFPHSTLIAAHAGAHWRLCLDILRQFPRNAYVDISGCIPEQGMLESLVKIMGARQILFGSDLLGRSQASQLAKVSLADITPQEMEAILWKNARRVFGLKSLPSVRVSTPKIRLRLPDTRTDHFCFCGIWPFLSTAARTPQILNRLLAETGIVKAYTGDLGSIYRQDLGNANREFIKACKGADRIAPLAILNPRDINWQDTLLQISQLQNSSLRSDKSDPPRPKGAQKWRDALAASGDVKTPPSFAGVILHPYLHSWRLDDPKYSELFKTLSAKHIPVWINMMLGDIRFRHSGMACRPVAIPELTSFAQTAPDNAYVIQGASAGHITDCLKHRPNGSRLRFEISRLTDVSGALAKALQESGTPAFVMGSEFPFRDIREVRWTAERERMMFKL